MNIFYLDRDTKVAAEMHCDKHVVKMILESAQMMSTAHRVLDGDTYADKTSYTKSRTRTIPALFGLGLLVATMTGCSSYGSTYSQSTRPATVNFTSQNFSYMGCLPFQRQSKTTGTSTHRNVCRPIVRMTIP